MMRRNSRIYLSHLNSGKTEKLFKFIILSHTFKQYFIDLIWQQGSTLKMYCEPNLIRKGVARFGISYRLAASIANESLAAVKAAKAQNTRRPSIKRHSLILGYHFATLEKSDHINFDFILKLGGCEVPILNIPFSKTAHLNKFLDSGWNIAKSFRIGLNKKHNLYLDLIFEKQKPKKRKTGKVIGIDSNYRGGMVISSGRIIGKTVYEKIQNFAKYEKNTHAQIKQQLNYELKHKKFVGIKTIAIEDLKYVKHFKRGTFSRSFNRRLSHWTYRYFMDRLDQICEEQGIWLVKKYPGYTSQTCSRCHRCDKRSRVDDRFECTSCGFSTNADLNAAFNLKTLGEAEVYDLRSLKNWKFTV